MRFQRPGHLFGVRRIHLAAVGDEVVFHGVRLLYPRGGKTGNHDLVRIHAGALSRDRLLSGVRPLLVDLDRTLLGGAGRDVFSGGVAVDGLLDRHAERAGGGRRRDLDRRVR